MKNGIRSVLAAAGMVAALGAQAQTLKLGVVGGMTGPGAPWGLAIDGGVKIAVDEINQAGGLEVGDKKYKVEVL
ncbi:MAG TPA: ABC transporter substrate-binding protein, partial [Alcaligenes faecalis]|nr:ABC transporter substrate-binding protein [Alcaligenes faecalis]